uniref:Uncharacterized protein n=1 Tax=Magallana gigas TaxID=29159 RepID=K1P6K7_MAGGI
MAKEVLFTYNLVLYVFRAGIRRNNAEAIFAARLKSSPLMFGMNKTNYQKIEILDSLMRQTDFVMPIVAQLSDVAHGLVPNYDKEHTVGVTGQQRMLTPPRHLFLPLSL